jgi:hypothetical protein
VNHRAPFQIQNDPEREDAFDQATNVLDSADWFDSSEGSLKPVDVPLRSHEAPGRNSDWLRADTGIPPAPLANTPPTAPPTSVALSVDSFFYIALVLFFLMIAGGLVAFFIRGRRDVAVSKRTTASRVREEAIRVIVESIPLNAAKVQRGDMLSETRSWIQKGDFENAIICYFGYQLLELDRANMIYVARGKTNGQYIREARKKSPALAEILDVTVRTFERTYFGRHELTAEGFDAAWRRVDDFQRLIQPQATPLEQAS